MTNNIVIEYHSSRVSVASLTPDERNAHTLLSKWLEERKSSIEEGVVTYEDYRFACKEFGVKAYFTNKTFDKAFNLNNSKPCQEHSKL